MEYRGYQYTNANELADVLEAFIHNDYVPPIGQYTRWEWLVDLGENNEVMQEMIGQAFTQLLYRDRICQDMVLMHMTSLHFDMTGPMLDSISELGPFLAERDRKSGNEKPVLASLIEKLTFFIRGEYPLSDESVDYLALSNSEEAGWPLTALMVAAARPCQHSQTLADAIERCDSNWYEKVASCMVSTGPPLTEDGFIAIGKIEIERRQAFANVVKGFLDDVARDRTMLLETVNDPDIKNKLLARSEQLQASGETWEGYAARLNVSP